MAVTAASANVILTETIHSHPEDKRMLDPIVEQVWQKAQYIDGSNEAKGFRKDQCGAWIQKLEYSNRDSIWGWEIDHIKPVSQGGSNDLSNLRPLHWRNNAARQDHRLVCVVQAQGTQNITV
jgi:hypothetical protein